MYVLTFFASKKLHSFFFLTLFRWKHAVFKVKQSFLKNVSQSNGYKWSTSKYYFFNEQNPFAKVSFSLETLYDELEIGQWVIVTDRVKKSSLGNEETSELVGEIGRVAKLDARREWVLLQFYDSRNSKLLHWWFEPSVLKALKNKHTSMLGTITDENVCMEMLSKVETQLTFLRARQCVFNLIASSKISLAPLQSSCTNIDELLWQ